MKKKYLSQLISLLVASTAAQGLLTTHALAVSGTVIDSAFTSINVVGTNDSLHITDTGSITGAPTTALTVEQNATLATLLNDGTISDDGTNGNNYDVNIVQINGAVTTFENTGTISSINQYHYGSIVAVGASGEIDNFTNSGTIKNAPDNFNPGMNNTGAVANIGYIKTLTNTADGKITGYTGINNQGRIDTLLNAGVITSDTGNYGMMMGDNAAIYNNMNSSIGTLHNTGTIQSISRYSYDGGGIFNFGTIDTLINDDKIIGGSFGIQNYGVIGTLENNGKITATNFGIYASTSNTTSIGTIANNGEISGANYGILISSYDQSLETNIINNGLLSGKEDALYLSDNNSSSLGNVTLTNSGVVAGNINANNTSPLKINGGTTTMGTLTGLNGIGTITSTRSNVEFGTGSLLLNDNVVASTVVNNAASLQVNNSITVTGDYHQKAAATLTSGISDVAISRTDLMAETGYGRLNVSGNATFDQGSSVNLIRTGNTYKFAEGQRYVVVNATGAETNYNADKLKYKAIGYRGAVQGSVFDDGENKALVLTVGAEQTVTPPVVTSPVVTAPGVTPPVVTAPVITPPVATPPTQPTQPDRGLATIPSATASLGGLGNYTGIASPQLLELFNASLAIDSKSEANRVGESLSPGQNINTSSAAAVATSTAQAVVGAHIDAVRNPANSGTSGVATGDDYASNWIVWGQPFGGYARQDSTVEVSGYSAKFGGLIMGADRSLGDDWRLGAAVNYSNTSVHGKGNLNGNTSTADNYGVIGYAGFTGDPWYLNLSAGVNRQNYTSVRRADFTGFSGAAQGKFNGQSVTLQTEFGYPLTLQAGVVLTPLASLTYGYQHVDGYKETGGNGMALDVGSSHAQSVVSDIGARIEKTFATGLGNLTPFAQVTWLHQYDDRQVSSRASYAADTVGETSFTTKGASPVEDMAGVAIGSTLYEANELNLDARYDLQAGERYQAHTFSLRLRKMF
ncbi:autotransporter outer membrane beta-barrel domain-containing protein [Enterobacter sp. 638]|uniref:Outer membrane autotransporter barrel domain n=1 Tax=Enterobacter sp. (strain 638) TaxID=399742 RepID=A0A9J9GIP9_ENT38|nr:autotransporter outer membrane beta-barrel domain-containing protein [Enterobacter sp. 638]ABP62045.1 outer membrane autotransporter barrel domain [Enterobacter sp. 638]